MKPRLLVIPLLAALPLVVFAQTARFPFIDFDDGKYVYDNPHVLGGLTAENVRWAFTSTTHGGKWMPATWLSFMLDAEFADRPSAVADHASAAFATPFHVTNVLLHTANVLLLFAVLRALTGAWWPSAVVAALFAIHPLRVESVAWVTERKDVLSTFFGLLALWGYVRYVRVPSVGRYALVAACFALSLMAKEMLVTLPFLLLLLDYWPLRRFAAQASGRRKPAGDPQPAHAPSPKREHEPAGAHRGADAPRSPVLEKLPLLALAVASSAIGLHAHRAGGAVAGLDAIPLSERFATAVTSYVFYLQKTVWPFDLAVYYPYRGGSIATWEIALSAAILALISLVAIRFVRRAPWGFVGWCWFLGTLVPVIGIVQIGLQSAADRFTYFPQIGLFVAIVWTAAAIVNDIPWRRIAAAALAVIVIAGLTVRASDQTRHWSDSEKLFKHAVAVTDPAPPAPPRNAAAHAKLAAYHRMRGERGLAIQELKKALECKPDNTFASVIHNDLGTLYAAEGPAFRDRAIHHLGEAVKNEPPGFRPYFNVGLLLAMDDDRLDAAAFYFKEALKRRLDSNHEWRRHGPMVWASLGDVRARQGRENEAEKCFAAARALDPSYDVEKARKSLEAMRLPAKSVPTKASPASS